MNKATFWQRGETLDYKNDTDLPIEAGEIVLFGKRIGVAGTSIPAGGTGTLHMEGVYKILKKAGEEIAPGTEVYYTSDGITAVQPTVSGAEAKTAEDRNVIGYVVESAAAEQSIALVKLIG